MFLIPKRRTTRWFTVAACALALTFVLRLGYLYYRPAMGEELQLVGRWRWVGPQHEFEFELDRNRRLLIGGTAQPGKWHVKDSVFRLAGNNLIGEARQFIIAAGRPKGMQLLFDDNNNVTAVNSRIGKTIHWQRVKETDAPRGSP